MSFLLFLSQGHMWVLGVPWSNSVCIDHAPDLLMLLTANFIMLTATKCLKKKKKKSETVDCSERGVYSEHTHAGFFIVSLK